MACNRTSVRCLRAYAQSTSRVPPNPTDVLFEWRVEEKDGFALALHLSSTLITVSLLQLCQFAEHYLIRLT